MRLKGAGKGDSTGQDSELYIYLQTKDDSRDEKQSQSFLASKQNSHGESSALQRFSRKVYLFVIILGYAMHHHKTQINRLGMVSPLQRIQKLY